MLSLLTGIVEPKSGSISINGKIFSFLSLGSTLDISRSGFENLRSALQMYDIKPTDDLIAELSEFTELPPEIFGSQCRYLFIWNESKNSLCPFNHNASRHLFA